MRQVKGNHRGVEHPIAQDAALIGDTRHPLHHAPLAKRVHPYDNHTSPVSNSAPGDEARDDQGIGNTMSEDGSC